MRTLPSLLSAGLLTLASLFAPRVAHADDAAEAPPSAGLRLSVIAPSADPPWTVRLTNEGKNPVRVPADVRLLSFELVRQKRGATAIPCRAPAGLRPTRFPESRALVLAPGETWEERFDPRLFCFDSAAEALTGSTLVRARYGWAPRYAGQRPKEPFVAQSLQHPESFPPLTHVDAPSFVLAYRRNPDPVDPPVPPPTPAPAAAPGEAQRTEATAPPPRGPHAHGAHAHGAEDHRATPPSAPAPADGPAPATQGADAAKAEGEAPPPPPAPTEDPNAGRVDVFVRRYADASSARDVVITIDAKNEGHRAMSAVLRGRMLTFAIEELGPDNQATSSTDCPGSHQPHAIPIEGVRGYRPGDKASIPLLLAEMCPRGVFARPGLYRVLPRIDTAVAGEALEAEAYVGKALARQSALVRIATGPEPFVQPPPKAKAPPAPPSQAPAEAPTEEPTEDDAAP